MVKVGAKVWIDETRIDHKHAAEELARKPGSTAFGSNSELSNEDGMVELTVPVDIGPLGRRVTVRFPISGLIRLLQP